VSVNPINFFSQGKKIWHRAAKNRRAVAQGGARAQGTRLWKWREGDQVHGLGSGARLGEQGSSPADVAMLGHAGRDFIKCSWPCASSCCCRAQQSKLIFCFLNNYSLFLEWGTDS
jgi:hypothetical protein